MEIAELAARLEALGNETRLTVYRLLVRAGRDGLSVGDVHEHTGVPRSTLSHHLRKLVSVGLVSQHRSGTTLYCRVDYAAMDETLGSLRAECCAGVVGHDDAAA